MTEVLAMVPKHYKQREVGANTNSNNCNLDSEDANSASNIKEGQKTGDITLKIKDEIRRHQVSERYPEPQAERIRKPADLPQKEAWRLLICFCLLELFQNIYKK